MCLLIVINTILTVMFLKHSNNSSYSYLSSKAERHAARSVDNARSMHNSAIACHLLTRASRARAPSASAANESRARDARTGPPVCADGRGRRSHTPGPAPAHKSPRTETTARSSRTCPQDVRTALDVWISKKSALARPRGRRASARASELVIGFP